MDFGEIENGAFCSKVFEKYKHQEQPSKMNCVRGMIYFEEKKEKCFICLDRLISGCIDDTINNNTFELLLKYQND